MSRKTKGSSFAFAALALILSVAPLTAQTTQSATTSATTDATATKAAKKAKKAKANPSTASPDAHATGNTLADVKTIPPEPAAKPVTVAAPPQKGMVWVNTASGVYHPEGSKYYGKTKQGKYMTVADAQKAGYHVAKSEAKQ